MMNTLDKETTLGILAKIKVPSHVPEDLGIKVVTLTEEQLQAFAQAVIEHVSGGEAVAYGEIINNEVFPFSLEEAEEARRIVKDIKLFPLFRTPPALEAENARLKEALKQALQQMQSIRRWVADGECSDDSGIYPNGATEPYINAVSSFDAVVASLKDKHE